MTKEEVKQALPLIQAFAEGKTIQTKNGSKWIDIDSDKNQFILDSVVTYQDCFRVKPKDVYRSFRNVKECWQEMQKHKPFGWIKGKTVGHYAIITVVGSDAEMKSISLSGNYIWSFNETMSKYTFADGTPFGIKEEC